MLTLFVHRRWRPVASAVSMITLLLAPAIANAGVALDAQVNEFIRSMPKQSIPGRYIVMLKDDTTVSLEALVHEYDMNGLQLFEKLRGFAGAMTQQQVQDLVNDNRVAIVEPDARVYALAQTLPTGVDRIDAEKSPTAKIDGVENTVNADIAILDTGVRKTHPDLNVVKQVNFSTEGFIADDLNGHGTHVAGIAAARDNGIGVVGVAPGARIWSVKVLDFTGGGGLSNVIAGIDYVTANASQIEVANMSLGCACVSAAMSAALTRSVAAGVVYTVAAGNSGIDATGFTPANHPDVITVSAVADYNGKPGGGAPSTCYSGTDDTFVSFSNFGAPVDIAAPGVCIYSTWRDGGYRTISGTSMAAPHVAGAVALYLATHAKPTDLAGANAVKTALLSAATPQSATGGFTGDPDGMHEPLLNVAGL